MEFLEDLDLYNRAMENAYKVITGKKSVKDLIEEFDEGKIKEIALPFDPSNHNGRSDDIIDMVVEHYEALEDFEKCAELINLKDNASEHK